jgi:hypothetical protein
MPKIQEGSIILGDYRLDDGDKKPHEVPAFVTSFRSKGLAIAVSATTQNA